MLKYIIIFFIFSILGWIYEYVLFDRHKSDDLTKKLFNINLPILQLYGLGGVVLLLIYENTGDYSMVLKLIIAAIILNSMECICGLISYNFFGYQLWKYGDNMIPMCSGYISLVAGLWWVFLSFVIFKLFDQFDLKN